MQRFIAHPVTDHDCPALAEWAVEFCRAVIVPGSSPDVMDIIGVDDWGPPFVVCELAVDDEYLEPLLKVATARGVSLFRIEQRVL